MDREHKRNKPNKGHQEGIYRPKKRCTWTRSTNGTNLTKDTVKRQNSMKDDSGVKEQYSRTSIFERIYQHCTTREQTTFTINHHHTTISDNSRLPENMPRPYIWVLSKQKNPDICLEAIIEEVFSSLEQLRFKILQLFVPNSKRLEGYTQWVHFFLQKKRTSRRRLPQDSSFSNNIRFKTLQLFVPNSKRLGGYT